MSRTALQGMAALLAAASAPTHAAVDVPSQARADQIERVIAAIDSTVQFEAVALSPDAKRLSWIARKSPEGSYVVTARADGRSPLTISVPEGCDPVDLAWGPNSALLAIVSNCRPADADAAIGSAVSIVDAGTGKPTQADLKLTGNAGALTWTSDGTALMALFVPNATRTPSAAAAASRATGSLAQARQEVQSVIQIDVENRSWRTVSDPSLYVYEYTQAPDGKAIAYTAAPPPGDANWWIAKLYVQSADVAKNPKLLFDPASASGVQKGLQITQPRWSPIDGSIAFIYGLMSDQGYSGGEIVTVDVQSGTLDVWNRGAELSTAWIDWTSQGAIVAGDIVGGSVELARYGARRGGSLPPRAVLARPAGLMSRNGNWVGASLTGSGAFAYIGSSFEMPPELYVGHANKPLADRAVTRMNSAVQPLWGAAVERKWTSEGKHVQGWLLRPAHMDASARYPMIVLAHGGPSGVSLSRWPDGRYDGAAFAAFGYMVFYPNPRGSFGGGAAFAEASRRDFGGGDFRDIMAGVDHVLTTDPADPERLGLTGWSYGGFMTMLGVTRTNRFKAAVAGAGISNWQSLYGQGLINEIFLPFFGASLYDDPEVYAASSPVFGLKAVRTPTLSLVGELDPQTPAAQSLEFWNGLRSLGVPSDLVIYENEGHQFVSPENRRDLLRRSLDWFDTYLRPERSKETD